MNASVRIPPICPTCALPSRLTDGREIYPHRPDLHAKPVWKCDGCEGYVGCHPGSAIPLGTPAGPELRRARQDLHRRVVDPLWQNAWQIPAYYETHADTPKARRRRPYIARRARPRVYAFLADRLGLTAEECHVGLFDLAMCRRAEEALAGVTYDNIRAWVMQQAEERC